MCQVHRCLSNRAPSYLAANYTFGYTCGSNSIHLNCPMAKSEFYHSSFELHSTITFQNIHSIKNPQRSAIAMSKLTQYLFHFLLIHPFLVVHNLHECAFYVSLLFVLCCNSLKSGPACMKTIAYVDTAFPVANFTRPHLSANRDHVYYIQGAVIVCMAMIVRLESYRVRVQVAVSREWCRRWAT